MNSNRKDIPVFRNEAEEREFWETHDSTEYLDWTQAQRAVFPNLKPTSRTISLRLPQHLLDLNNQGSSKFPGRSLSITDQNLVAREGARQLKRSVLGKSPVIRTIVIFRHLSYTTFGLGFPKIPFNFANCAKPKTDRSSRTL